MVEPARVCAISCVVEGKLTVISARVICRLGALCDNCGLRSPTVCYPLTASPALELFPTHHTTRGRACLLLQDTAASDSGGGFNLKFKTSSLPWPSSTADGWHWHGLTPHTQPHKSYKSPTHVLRISCVPLHHDSPLAKTRRICTDLDSEIVLFGPP